jgi:hypothetical protein
MRPVSAGRGPDEATEVAAEVALIVEARGADHARDRHAGCQQSTGDVDPELHVVRMRRQTERA